MPKGLCVYIEHNAGVLEASAAELAEAAFALSRKTGEPVQALLLARDADSLLEQLAGLPVDEIHVLPVNKDIQFQDDAASVALAEAIRRLEPSAVLVPATSAGKSVFSRVAAILGCGMTADCTDVGVELNADGTCKLLQNKPSYGDNVMVTIVSKPGVFPQMLTIRPGIFVPLEHADRKAPAVSTFSGIEVPESGVEVLEETSLEGCSADNIASAEVVVVGGRGALEADTVGQLQELACKLGGAFGGTRPLADTEIIAFENQIGQTGFTIRPKICLSFGVSGAIQHVEGIKDTKLFIAINPDDKAPIYNFANYGVAREMQGILKHLLG